MVQSDEGGLKDKHLFYKEEGKSFFINVFINECFYKLIYLSWRASLSLPDSNPAVLLSLKLPFHAFPLPLVSLFIHIYPIN